MGLRPQENVALKDGDRVYFYVPVGLRISVGIVFNCDHNNGWISVKREDGKYVTIWYTELYTDLKYLLRQVVEHLDGKIDEYKTKLHRVECAKDQIVTRFRDDHDEAIDDVR